MEDKIKFVHDCIEEYNQPDKIIFEKLIKFRYSKYGRKLNVDNVSDEILLKALAKNPQLLTCIKNQTYDMIKIAIEQTGTLVKFAKLDNLTDEQAEEIGIIACKHGGQAASRALKNYKKLTRKLVVNAIIGWTEIWFNMSTEEFKLIDNQESMNEIVKACPYMFGYINKKYQTEELHLIYMQESSECLLKNIPEKYLNKDLVLKKININMENLSYENILKYITIEEYKDFCIKLISKNYEYSSYINKNILNNEILLELVKINPKVVIYIKTNDIDVAYEVLKQDKSLVKYFDKTLCQNIK